MRRVPIILRNSRLQRGAASPVVIAAVVIVILLAVAAWYFSIRSNEANQALVQPNQASGAAAAASAPPPPANVSSMGVDELLNEAKKSMAAKRFIAPAGNNAFEFYLKVLEKRPGNMVAQDALRETFPFAASAAEQDINANNFEEAQREISLLAKADPGNYTLTILRSKLDAQRKLASRAEEQQKRAEDLATQQEAQREQAAAESAQQAEPEQQAQGNTAGSTSPQQQQVTSTPSPNPPQPVNKAPDTSATPAPVGPTRGARLVKSTQPVYPPAALRRRQQGWVDVQFTVEADGKVSNVHSIDSNRGRVFERAAISAVEQWKFDPALNNGTPVSKVLVQRIEFKL